MSKLNETNVITTFSFTDKEDDLFSVVVSNDENAIEISGPNCETIRISREDIPAMKKMLTAASKLPTIDGV